MFPYDYLVVGSGLTGATIARILCDSGKTVLLLERRPRLGGNVFDVSHPSGIRVHVHGPHYFRTSSQAIWDFVQRFADFYPYEAAVQARVGDAYENWPIAASYIRREIGENWLPESSGEARNLEEAALSLMPRKIYDLFVKEYNEKQWGVPATQLSPELCKRFDVRADDDPRLTPLAKYQGLPADGYAAMVNRMLSGIPSTLNFDYLEHREFLTPTQTTVFTGPIDEYFDFCLGRLQYRSQRRFTEYLPDIDHHQPVAQVNNPLHAGGTHIRTLEWKRMMEKRFCDRIHGTVITREVPFSPQDPDTYEYPFPDSRNKNLYRRYREMADQLENVVICGRLGEYHYCDMDHAIERAMVIAKKLLDKNSTIKQASR